MDVLITGGAGFIGANLAKTLTQSPDIGRVIIIDDLSSGSLQNIKDLDIEFVEGSILDEDALVAAGAGVDAIVHLAAVPSVPRSIVDPLRSHEANATGTLKILQFARKTNNAHVILASSSSVYGANPVLPKSEDLRCEPMSPYAVSKLATEQYAMAFARCYNVPVLPFRFFNVFGPLQAAGHAYAAVVPAFVDAALRGKAIPLNGDGTQSRDFTYVGTVTSVIADALANKVTSSPVNLAFGTRTTLLELIMLLEDMLGRDLPVERREPRAGDVPHSQASNDLLRSLFPGVSEVGLREGLESTIHWMSEASIN